MENSKHIIIINEELYHIGDLNHKKQRINSYESDTLSVSLHPDDWIKIAKLGGKNKYILSKKDAKFLDIVSAEIDALFLKEVNEWGLDKGYITTDKIYKNTWYDDEIDCEMFTLHDSYEEALKECMEEENISTINGIFPTELLNKERNHGEKIELINTQRFLLFQYAKEEMKLDGIWIDSILDPNNYQAPAGGIFNMTEWNIKTLSKKQKVKP